MLHSCHSLSQYISLWGQSQYGVLRQDNLVVSVGVAFLVAVPFVRHGARRSPFPRILWRSHMVDTLVGVAAVVAVAGGGAVLVVRFSRRARTGIGSLAQVAALVFRLGTDAHRFGKLTSLAFVVSAVAIYAYGAAGCYC